MNPRNDKSSYGKPRNDKPAPMTACFAPYNFVPHAARVLFPSAQEVHYAAQDLPHPDGMCGQIELDLLADGPLLVAANQTIGQDGIKQTRFFRTPDQVLAIPGSSLRGMLANVLKIALFGKLNRVDDVRLAMRDLTKGAEEVYQGKFSAKDNTATPPLYISNVKTGWLSFVDGHWQLQACEVARVERLPRLGKELKPEADNLYQWAEGGRAKPLLEADFRTLLGSGFGRQFYRLDEKRLERMGATPRLDKDTLKPRKLALDKVYAWWEKLGGGKSSFPLLPMQFTPGPDEPHPHDRKQLQYRKATQLGTGNTKGTLVLTAHPGSVKHMEFIFYDCAQVPPPQTIPDADFMVFRQANENWEAWKFWMGHLKSGKIKRIPVFYLPADAKTTGPQFRLGFTQLFKLPMQYSLHEALANTSSGHLDPRPDYAELLFGRLLDQAGGQQAAAGAPSQWQGKGRIDFSLARLNTTVDGYQEVCRPILPGTPKPTYYPNYVRQKGKSGPGLQTLLHDGAQLRGWKRYQIKLSDTNMLDDMKAKTAALEPASKVKQQANLYFIQPKDPQQPLCFGLRLHFHNLQAFELGALLWALSWGGDADKYHGLGMGKAYGAGAVRFRIKSITWRENSKLAQGFKSEAGPQSPVMAAWQSTFAARMDQLLQTRWQDTVQIQSLLALATRQTTQLEKWRYMKLEMRGENQFQQAKKDGASLPMPETRRVR
jgi:hypothetical protein